MQSPIRTASRSHGTGGSLLRRRFREPSSDWCHGVLRFIPLALRTTQVRHQDCLATPIDDGLDGRESRDDSAIIGDVRPIQRHIEVHTDQNPFSSDDRVLDCLLCHDDPPRIEVVPTRHSRGIARKNRDPMVTAYAFFKSTESISCRAGCWTDHEPLPRRS